MNKQLEILIDKNHLSELKDTILEHCKQSVRLILNENKEDSSGKSKLGGMPHISEEIPWPTYNDRPLSFIGQINLNDISIQSLPDHGILYFFYDMEEQPFGDELDEMGSSKVIYQKNLDTISIRQYPEDLDDEYCLDETYITFDYDVTIPTYNSEEMKSWNLTSTQKENYYDLLIAVVDHAAINDIIHRMIGYPDEVQGNMEEQCNELFKTNTKWSLLLQLETNEDINMVFSYGMIYFWIKEEDLKNLNFNNVWSIVQCS
jgi:uncharacterized protein YwqG